MSKPEHTPEPWETVGATRIWRTGKGGGAIAIITEPQCKNSDDFREVRIGSKRWDEAMANADRICAAINDCKGIPTAALKGGVVAELLAACEWTLDAINGYWDSSDREYFDGQRMAERLRSVIAKVKGETT